MRNRVALRVLAFLGCAGATCQAGPLFLRLRLDHDAVKEVSFDLAGATHKSPWALPRLRVPEARGGSLPTGTWSDWLDYGTAAKDRLHGPMNRAGGVAELPCLTVRARTPVALSNGVLRVELATAPNPAAVRKRWVLRLTPEDAGMAGFLVSTNLEADHAALESSAEMSARRLRWAEEATGGERVSPEHHIIQTSLWSPQSPARNLDEARVLWLLGFNVLGNAHAPIPERYGFRLPGHTHRVAFGPGSTQEEIDGLMAGHAAKQKRPVAEGVPFGFSDEIAARPRIGEHPKALAHLRAWLAEQGIAPADLGVAKLDEVTPIETPEQLRERMAANESAARRVFYHTSRFRQLAGTERIRWHTEAFHRHFGDGPLTSSLLADHPYFGGTGLGMGMKPDSAWGNHALALDWFDLARTRALDLVGIEDWMGLQYMYGPNYTWEGFQLMGFQAAMIRSGARSGGHPDLPIIAWITPSDETNLRLKAASALCQGARHFFFWTYGPTCTSTENYWSDLRGAYDGVAAVTRHLAACDDIVARGRQPEARIAVLYSVSSDLWQPFDYLHMLERRCLYLALAHDQRRVDFLTEEDVVAGRLADYEVAYCADPCLRSACVPRVADWVRKGGHLVATCGAGSHNEFGERAAGLREVLGLEWGSGFSVQPGRYRVRGGLNAIPVLDRAEGLEWIGLDAEVALEGAEVMARFADGSPARCEHGLGKGRATTWVGTPGVSYAKAAKFVPEALEESWPADWRDRLVAPVREMPRAVALSEAVVEAGLYTRGKRAALVLANFTYQPLAALEVEVALPFRPARVRSVEAGPLEWEWRDGRARFRLPLGLSDVVVF